MGTKINATEKDRLIDIANQRGFTLWATLNGKKLQFMDERGINLFVEIESKSFSLRYLVPRSIFTLNCPECSPFDNDEHFNKIYRKFKHEVVECWSFGG